MRILVDARPLITFGNGNARYLAGMLDAAVRRMTDWHWHLISPKGLHSGHAGIFSRPNVELLIDRSLFAKSGPTWLHGRVPTLINEIRPDLFWSTLFLLPHNYRKRTDVPVILNVHDVNPFVAPETMKGWNRLYSRMFLRESILAADRVLCLSATTRNDILRTVPDVDPAKLTVLYPGMSVPPAHRKMPVSFPVDVKEFYLAVGTLEARKNFETLIRAYLHAQLANPYLPALVIAGSRGWKVSTLLEDLQANRLTENRIFYVPSPSDAELFWLYENALALFFSSLHEGFGLPALEALYFKKPVYLSDIPIFREILPEADFTPPLDVQGWARRFQYHYEHGGKVLSLNKKEWTYEYRSRQLCEELRATAGL
jgi:glycosyltransferase involved in cell wall biosynthesis